MWLSKRNVNKERQNVADMGETTSGGNDTSVYTEGELRHVGICAPGGYIWRPSVGRELLVIKDGGGTAYAVGAAAQEPPGGFRDGEVFISSAGGASVWLKNDGSILLSGKINIDGSLFLNGAEID